MVPNNNEKRGEGDIDNRQFVFSIRSILYAITFALIFGLTCANLGLVSQQIHRYGRYAENYASLEYKNALGLLLCAVLVSLLLCIFHFWLPVGITAFTSLIMAVFFGTVAGIFQETTPFRGHSCHKLSQDQYPEKWRPYYKECSRVVAMEGMSWTLFALYFFLLFGTLGYMFGIQPKATPGGYYASPNRQVPVV